jgi:hypothetical protein
VSNIRTSHLKSLGSYLQPLDTHKETGSCIDTVNKVKSNSQLAVSRNAFDFGEVPFFVAEWANASGLQPTLDTVQMKHMTTVSEGNGQAVVIGWRRVGLILDGRLIERVAANSALPGNRNGTTMEDI